MTDHPSSNSHPNIFRFATKELSQDAFLCWLISWAAATLKRHDAKLHGAGIEFVNRLLSLHQVPPRHELDITIHRQLDHTDIVVEIDDDVVLLIEDKTHTQEGENQLTRYLGAIQRRFPNRRLIPIFIKTGDQCSYAEVIAAGFKCFLRSDLLDFLNGTTHIEHPVLRDFHSYLLESSSEIDGFDTIPIANWDRRSKVWVGFFKRLKQEREKLEWKFVNNQSGGFYGGWWHGYSWRGHDVYLQIEGGPLCFKLGVKDQTRRGEVRTQWKNHLERVLDEYPDEAVTAPARLGTGTWMTVKMIPSSAWIARNGRGLIDWDGTLRNLERAEDILRLSMETEVNG